MTYKHYPVRPDRLTSSFVSAEYQRLADRIATAEASDSPEGWLELFSDWNALKSYANSEENRISYALTKDMNNAEHEAAERYHRESVRPAVEEGNYTIVKALLSSRHRQAISDRYGAHLIDVLETTVEPLASVNSQLRVLVGELVNRYDKLVAGGEVVVGGEKVTLSVARNMTSSSDPAIRREAFVNYRQWFLDHRLELADLYDQLVRLRDQMGKNLGYDNYIPLGLKVMGRTDYGVAESETFRKNVREFAVPLYASVCRQQAEELGSETLTPWDAGYTPSLTLPSGVAPIETQLEKAQRVFDALSPKLSSHFKRMRDEGLIDLENRRGKQAGAYCTSFSDEGRVAIFCNSTGDEEDVGTLMHEMGHAFQGWESQPIEAVDLQWPTYDACEIHSMGMEYLSMRYMTEFFTGDQAERFRRNRWKEAIALVCYICVVDEFQHWAYAHPDVTFDERDAAWDAIWDTYTTGIDFTGVEQYKSARWYAQGHLFHMPFYYIDYAIAETGAMQLAMIDAEDHARAVDVYMELCRVGGTLSVLDIFRNAGLRSPFDPDLMRDLMNHAAEELGVVN